jgi:hypothetical protein
VEALKPSLPTFGSPAVILSQRLDPWLCVAAFQRVCPFVVLLWCFSAGGGVQCPCRKSHSLCNKLKSHYKIANSPDETSFSRPYFIHLRASHSIQNKTAVIHRHLNMCNMYTLLRHQVILISSLFSDTYWTVKGFSDLRQPVKTHKKSSHSQALISEFRGGFSLH